jgi:hypothetical protein
VSVPFILGAIALMSANCLLLVRKVLIIGLLYESRSLRSAHDVIDYQFHGSVLPITINCEKSTAVVCQSKAENRKMPVFLVTHQPIADVALVAALVTLPSDAMLP